MLLMILILLDLCSDSTKLFYDKIYLMNLGGSKGYFFDLMVGWIQGGTGGVSKNTPKYRGILTLHSD